MPHCDDTAILGMAAPFRLLGGVVRGVMLRLHLGSVPAVEDGNGSPSPATSSRPQEWCCGRRDHQALCASLMFQQEILGHRAGRGRGCCWWCTGRCMEGGIEETGASMAYATAVVSLASPFEQRRNGTFRVPGRFEVVVACHRPLELPIPLLRSRLPTGAISSWLQGCSSGLSQTMAS